LVLKEEGFAPLSPAAPDRTASRGLALEGSDHLGDGAALLGGAGDVQAASIGQQGFQFGVAERGDLFEKGHGRLLFDVERRLLPYENA
jgi:hypothetical protein